MKLSVSAFRGAQASAHKKLFNTGHTLNYDHTSKFSSPSTSASFQPLQIDDNQMMVDKTGIGPGDPPVKSDSTNTSGSHESPTPQTSPQPPNIITPLVKISKSDDHHIHEKGQRTRSNQRWMKLRTTVQLSGAISSTIQKPKPQLKREDSFLKRFSTRQIPETQETMDTGDDGDDGSSSQGEPETLRRLRRRKRRQRKKQPTTVVNPDENFYYYWLLLVSICVLYNLWTLIVRQSFPEFQDMGTTFWFFCDSITDLVFILDIVVQFRTGYLEQGLMVYDSKKLAKHYVKSRPFVLDLVAMIPLQLLQFKIGTNPILRFPRFMKVYRVYDYYYMVESRTVYPNLWRVVNLIHILLILAHWFGCFYYLLSQAEGFKGDWVYPYRPTTEYATLTRKYLGSLYWSTLTLTTIGDLPTPETNAEFIFTIVSYLIGVFIFATIVGQVGNVITNRNANRLEFERLLDGAKTYMRHHKVPSGMKRRVLRWYDYSWSRGRIQGGGDINTALGLLPDKLKTELALHVNLSVLKKVTIFQECQPEFLHDLVLKMKAFIFTPGDLICRKGEVAREMFIIADGILEVISETGHVLTTMMAGDFFGEIGILNLDGLNKRTADVRSVGYSELFSLSREDVLAAMKDYPEAQEILQTLGRKRLMEARNVTKAVIEQRKQAELQAMVRNAEKANEHRSKHKIVERIYSDVKGLKNVLRKSRRGTKSEDSLELQPLTSISGKTDSQHHAGSKGTLCRMQKVISEDNQEDESSASTSERRISAGFPLLNKLKTLTDKHHQNHRQLSARSDSGDHFEQPKEEVEIEPIGAGLPLLQRLLLLKQKEDKEKNDANYVPSTVRTQHQQPICPAQTIGRKSKSTKKEVVFAEDVLQKEGESKTTSTRHEKREFMKPWHLLRKATINQNSRFRDSKPKIKQESSTTQNNTPDDTVSACEGRKSVNTHRCLTRLYGSGIKTAQSISSIQNAKKYDNTLVNICDSSESGDLISNSNSNDSNKNFNNINISSSNSMCSGSSEVIGSSSCKTNQLVGVDREMKEMSTTKQQVIAVDTTRLQLPSNARPTSLNKQSKKYCSVDDLSPEYTSLPFVKRLKILNERQKLAELEENAVFIRSCSLDSSKGTICVRGNHTPVSLTRSSSEATVLEVVSSSKIYEDAHNMYSLSTNWKKHELTSPESYETLERRKLKSILKKISSSNCKISDLLGCARASDADNATNTVLRDLQCFRRLMNAQTIEGYLARHSTFEKSVTYHDTVLSPPSTGKTLKSSEGGDAFPFDESSPIPISVEPVEDKSPITDTAERKYLEREASHSPSKNPDLIPEMDVIEDDSSQSLMFASQHLPGSNVAESYGRFSNSSFGRDTFEGIQNVFRSQVKEIEQEVRKRDMLIEVLQTRIQELQRHHEQCFQECSSSEDETDCGRNEPAFLRGDSVDTVLLSPSQMINPNNQEYQRHIDHSLCQVQPAILLQNRRSWEDPSEEDNRELRDLPTSMKPCPVWREDISIDIASDTSTSASETDELFRQLEDDLQLTSHDRDWEVRMLARELEKREHKESQFHRLKSDSGLPKMQLLNVRSLEERGTENRAAPSQRSISSDNIYCTSAAPINSGSPFRTINTSATRSPSSVSPDVVPVPVVTSSPPGS